MLVVSEICAREYDAREARCRGARIEDWAMGRTEPYSIHRVSGDELEEVDKALVADATVDTFPRAA